MSSCGKEYCPDSKCAFLHPFNRSRRERCERVKRCQSRVCAPLSSLGDNGFILYDSCLGNCHQDEERYQSHTEWLCDKYDPADIAIYYGVNPCGVNIPPVNPVPAIESAKGTDGQNYNKYYLFAGALVLAISAILLLKKK